MSKWEEGVCSRIAEIWEGLVGVARWSASVLSTLVRYASLRPLCVQHRYLNP